MTQERTFIVPYAAMKSIINLRNTADETVKWFEPNGLTPESRAIIENLKRAVEEMNKHL